MDEYKVIIDSLKTLSNSSIRWGARGENNVKKLVWNEFGTSKNGKEHIPERAPMRKTFNDQEVQKKLSKALEFVIKSILNGKELNLNGIGEVGLAELKKTFTSNLPPANAPSTIKKKGPGKNTLYDTGELFRSLGYEVIT